AKIIFTVLMCICVFLKMPLYVQYALTLAVTVLSVVSVGMKITLRTLRLMLPVIIFMIIFMPLQERSGSPIVTLGEFTLITREGLLTVQVLLNRFITISVLCTLLIQTASSRDILLALRFFRLPYSASLVLSLALRFIPSFASTFSRIRDSQRLRLPNPDEDSKGGRGYIKLMPTFTSALVVALKSISTTAAFLDLRGYGRNVKRSDFHVLPFGVKQFTHLALSVILPLLFLITLEVIYG
ncbi:MAG: energy-coupling factor transporter transmembrane component T family protein, partial [Bullifex sp.]